jgi:hypothetical protein
VVLKQRNIALLSYKRFCLEDDLGLYYISNYINDEMANIVTILVFLEEDDVLKNMLL